MASFSKLILIAEPIVSRRIGLAQEAGLRIYHGHRA